jgi:putative nucleotidyltransferase with HDIG domain
MTELHPLRLAPLMERIRPLLPEIAQPVHLVGGAVRDARLGRASHDIDLIVAEDAIPLAFWLANQLHLPAYALDAERDVGRIIARGQATTLDIARYRGPTLEDDLRGRDFTINALALPAGAQTADAIIDRHDGLDDLHAGRVRIIHGDSIADDPVRALRAARFAAQLGFTLTPETAEAARAALPALLARTSAERIRDELTKLLSVAEPRRGVALLDELGLLAGVLPEIAALRDVVQSPPHHEAVLAHTQSVLHYLAAIEHLLDEPPGGEAVEWVGAVEMVVAPYRVALRNHLNRPVEGDADGRALLRWGALYHDAGKRATQTIDEMGRIRFLGHDEAGAALVATRLSRLNFGNAATRHARDIVAGHMRPLHLAAERRAPSRRAIYRYYRALHGAGLDVGLLSLADHLATYAGAGPEDEWRSLLTVVGALFAAYFDAPHEAVAPPRLLTGRDVMNLLNQPPGHEIGRLLALLEEAQAAGEVTTRAEALAFVREHAES